LKSEQEEYAREGIAWQPIPFFNNRVVCELIEGSLSNAVRLPPGIFSLLDDVCATMHAESKGADSAFANKVLSIHGSHAHCASAGSKIGFIVKHYAGDVEYRALDFPEKNSDALGNEIILSLQASTKKLIPILFGEVVDLDSKKKPQTAGHKIRQQTKELVAALMASNPHYIRTIKSNDVKKANYMDVPRVLFQVGQGTSTRSRFLVDFLQFRFFRISFE
jgi:myosin-1